MNTKNKTYNKFIQPIAKNYNCEKIIDTFIKCYKKPHPDCDTLQNILTQLNTTYVNLYIECLKERQK